MNRPRGVEMIRRCDNQGNGVCFGTSMGLQAGQVAHASLAQKRQDRQRGVDMGVMGDCQVQKVSDELPFFLE